MASISRARPYNNSQHRPVLHPAPAIGIEHGEDSQCQEAVSGKRLARPPTIRTTIPPRPPQTGRGGQPGRGRGGWNPRGRGGYNGGRNPNSADDRRVADAGARRSEQPGATGFRRPNGDSHPGRTIYKNASWHRSPQGSTPSQNSATTAPATSRPRFSDGLNEFSIHTLPPLSSSSFSATLHNGDKDGLGQSFAGPSDNRYGEESSSTDKHIALAPGTQPQHTPYQKQPNIGVEGVATTFSDMYFPYTRFRGGLVQHPPSWATQTVMNPGPQFFTQPPPALPLPAPAPAPPDATTDQHQLPIISPKSNSDEPRPAKRQRRHEPSEELSLSSQPSPMDCQPFPNEAQAASQETSMLPEAYTSNRSSSSAPPSIPHLSKTNDPVTIKQERLSPSPPALFPSAKQVTSGSRRHAPMPENCMRTNPDYKKCRNTWRMEMCDELVRKGLRVRRSFIRDDGLVIDWESTEPVMSDTLLPLSQTPLPPHTEQQYTSLSHHSPHSDPKLPSVSLNQPQTDMRPTSRDLQAVAPKRKRKRKNRNIRPTLAPSDMSQYKHVQDDQGRDVIMIDNDEDVQESSPTVTRPTTPTISSSHSLPPPPSTLASSPGPDVNDFPSDNGLSPTNPTDSPPLWLLDSASLISFGEGTRDDPSQATGKSTGPVKTPLARFNESLAQKRRARLAAEGGETSEQRLEGNGNVAAGTTLYPGSAAEAEMDLSGDFASSASPTDGDEDWAEGADLEDAALEYLKRYIFAFDKDRLSLSKAYSPDATFSFQRLIPRIGDDKPPAVFDKSELTRGRHNIASVLGQDSMDTVDHGPSHLRFCSAEEPLDLQYDVVCLEHSRVLLVAHASLRHTQLGAVGDGMEVDNEQDRRPFGVTMSFVLRRRTDSDVDGVAMDEFAGGRLEDRLHGTWPLVATAHQMIVRLNSNMC